MQFIFITGVSSGIGRHLAEHLLGKGIHVIGTVRNQEDASELFTRFPQQYHPIVYDVTDAEGLNRVIKEVEKILNGHPLYGLINNSGIVKAGPLEVLPEADFNYQMEVNLFAVFRITNALLPFLGTAENFRTNEGRVVNISSISGLFVSPFVGAYSISKFALEAMSDAYRRELSLFGIKVILIEPGPIKTRIWGKSKGSMTAFANSHYGPFITGADRMIENSEKGALPLSAVSEAVDKALFLKNPSIRYLVHKGKIQFWIISKLLPVKWVDRLIHKTLSKKDKFRPI